MVGFGVSIERAGPEVDELLDDGHLRRDLNLAVAGGVATLMQRHFLGRNRTPNQLGGRRSNFWGQMARATAVNVPQTTDKTGVVSVSDGRFNLKVFGGRVTPKRAKALTIPVRPESYGLRVRKFEEVTGLKLFSPGGRPYLAARVSGGALRVFSLLVKSTDHGPDPEALPDEGAIDRAVSTSADDFFAATSASTRTKTDARSVPLSRLRREVRRRAGVQGLLPREARNVSELRSRRDGSRDRDSGQVRLREMRSADRVPHGLRELRFDGLRRMRRRFSRRRDLRRSDLRRLFLDDARRRSQPISID